MSTTNKYNFDNSEYEKQLLELAEITTRLKSISSYLFSIILFNSLALVFFSIIKLLSNPDNDRHLIVQFFILAILINLVFTLLGVFLLWRFNNLKKRGMIYYDELTDEIDWSNKRKEFMYRPPIDMRIVIKDFIKSCDLPFTSGPNGMVFYLLILIILTISTIIIFSF